MYYIMFPIWKKNWTSTHIKVLDKNIFKDSIWFILKNHYSYQVKNWQDVVHSFHFFSFLTGAFSITRWTVLTVILKRWKCSWIIKHNLDILKQYAMVPTPMLSTRIFQIAQVNIVKEVELDIIWLLRK